MNASLHHTIRPYRPADEAAVVGLWHRAGRAAYTYLPTWQALTLEQAHQVFREVIAARCELWVGALDERVVAYLALRGSYIDRLYVDPPEQRKGWGSRLIEHAKALHPTNLELHTHQENPAGACVLRAARFRRRSFWHQPAARVGARRRIPLAARLDHPEGGQTMRDLLAKILPESLMAQIEEESKSWYFQCSCGHEFDIWSMGGMRFKAAGKPKQLVTCPACGKTAFLELNKR